MKIFISYSRDDKNFVYELAQRLKDDAQHDVWIDKRLIGADQWWDEICKSIEWCECFVSILTPKSTASIYCGGELDYGLALKKPILPLMLKQADLPAALHKVQYTDIGSITLEQALFKCEQGLHGVERRLWKGEYLPPSPLPLRPSEPVPQQNPEHLFEVFSAAEEAAAAGNLTLAEKHFRQVITTDPQGLGVAAAERLGELKHERERAIAYTNLVRLAANPATLRGAAAAWRVYVQKYGVEYDPNGLAQSLTGQTAISTPLPIKVLKPAGDSPFSKRQPPLSTPPHIEVVAPPPPEPAEPTLGSRMTDDKGVTMVYVPAGKFLMGSTQEQVDEMVEEEKKENKNAQKEWYRDQMSQHEQVIERGFWLDLMPVTNEAYGHFVHDSGYRAKDLWTAAGWTWMQEKKRTGPEDYTNFTEPQQPRVGATWFEADAYCRWRNGRLPTEAEWEYAARGPDSRIYPWGNTFDPNKVIYRENSGSKAAVVGEKIRTAGASWVGALDLSGNVWEWCSSLYRPYPYSAADEHESNINDNTIARVLRGGSWGSFSIFLRSALRGDGPSVVQLSYLGFRCARS